MNFDVYEELFQAILAAESPAPPYDQPAYMNYVRLNWSRQQRWLKSGLLNPALEEIVKGIREKQTWLVITEPWCGDAAHIIPFLHRLAGLNPLIREEYALRDTPPFLIERYLSNKARSIPKFIVRDSEGNDKAVWGPRPAACQRLYEELLRNHADGEEKKIALQQWYNHDKGVSLQEELIALLR